MHAMRHHFARLRPTAWSLSVLMLVTLLGCGGSNDGLSGPPNILVGRALPAADGPRVTLSITPAADANDALPFYMMARTVKEQAYLVEPYQSVADRVMKPDDSVLETWVVHPGRPQVVNLKLPKDGRLAIYALFSRSNGTWKTLLPPDPPGHVRVQVTDMHLVPEAAR